MHCPLEQESVCLLGQSGERRIPPSNTPSPLSPGQPSHLQAHLSLRPCPPAAAGSGLRRPGDERPWRRLRALRPPRLCGRLQLQRLPQMLNPSCLVQKSKNLSFCPQRLGPLSQHSYHGAGPHFISLSCPSPRGLTLGMLFCPFELPTPLFSLDSSFAIKSSAVD